MIMASSTGHVMNLSNSIIGVSLLAMPFCFKQCGITLAILMLILSSIISRLACHFLVKSSTMCRRRNFEFLAFYTFGPSGKLLVELGVIGFMMGTCVAFFVVMGDLGPAIISKIFNINNNSTLRTSVLIGLGLLVVLPLGLLRNVESLAAISTVTIGYYFLFIIKIFFESSPHLASGDWWSHVRFWQPEGVLQCVPIFAMALSCQTQLFEIYNSLPSPSIEKMNSVVHSALNLCTVVYTCVGLLGYIAFCKGNFTGNIMLSFTPSLSSEMFKLGFVLSIAVSFPLVIFPCRASLFSLMFKRMPIHQELTQTSSHIPDSRFKCLTVGIVSVALVTGLLIPSIELVLGFVGSTIGIAICVIFPSLSFLNLCNKNTNERTIAKMILFLGVVIMIMGTFGNLFAAVEQKSVQLSPEELGHSKYFQQVKVPNKIQSSTEITKKLNSKDGSLVDSIVPEKSSLHKSPEALKPRIKISENVRKEPPVPIAPLTGDKEKQNNQQVQIEIIEKKKDGETKKLAESEEKKPKADFPEVKRNENIAKDAIEKEEREIMEVEQQKKTEEDRKQQELLQRLKEHQDEQKKLLEEQEKILKEMKDRKKENKLKEEPKPPSDAVVKEVKNLKPAEFSDKIQVFDNVKDTKSIVKEEKLNEKEKVMSGVRNESERLSSEKPKGAETRVTEAQSLAKVAKEETKKAAAEVRSPVVSVPLPLAKRFHPEAKEEDAESKKEEKKKKKEKSKQDVLARDILVERMSGREKRDADESGGKCLNDESKGKTSGENEKTEKLTLEKKNISEEASNRSSVLIKNSEHLSSAFQLSNEKKPEMGAPETAKLILELESQPFMPKKRDLKSVSPGNG